MNFRLLDAVEVSLGLLSPPEAQAFRSRVGWGVPPIVVTGETGESFGRAYERAQEAEMSAYRTLDAGSAWPAALARRTAGISPRAVHRLALEAWADGLAPDMVERLVGFVWAGTPGDARKRPDHWQRMLRIAEGAALAMPAGSTPVEVARAAVAVLSPTSMRLSDHLLAALGLPEAG